jgi:hypothetical protein
MSAEPQHICPSCGNEYSGAIGFCPRLHASQGAPWRSGVRRIFFRGKLIRRSGPLKVKLALEIVSQVAAGLAAIHQ